jgi:hypothetical protein
MTHYRTSAVDSGKVRCRRTSVPKIETFVCYSGCKGEPLKPIGMVIGKDGRPSMASRLAILEFAHLGYPPRCCRSRYLGCWR